MSASGVPGQGGPDRSVLMVSYVYPPVSSPGALRAVKFAKYLPGGGWRAVVVAPNAAYSSREGWRDSDDDAVTRVVRTADPLGIQRASAGLQRAVAGSGRRGVLRQALVRAGQAVVVPDRAAPWAPFALKAAARVIREDGVSAVFSSSPPITNHLIALRLSRRFGLPWIADFRDPWTRSLYYAGGLLRGRVDRALERAILRGAHCIVVVSETIREQFAEAFPHIADKLAVIRNGFDPDDFVGLSGTPPTGRFVLTYAGMFYGRARNAGPLLEAIGDLRREGVLDPARFVLRLVGPADPVVAADAAAAGVADMVEAVGTRPYHETLRLLAESSASLVICHTEPEARGEMPTKFFDYLGVSRPVVLLAPHDWELARLARGRGLAQVAHPDRRDEIAALLRRLVNGGAAVPDAGAAAAFTREAGAAQLAALLDGMVP